VRGPCRISPASFDALVSRNVRPEPKEIQMRVSWCWSRPRMLAALAAERAHLLRRAAACAC
jgi:hypothetical protein